MTTPTSSTVVIEYDGTDITQYVLFSSARFECQSNAVPGTCSFSVKDQDRNLSFQPGKEVYLYVDGQKLFGGIVMRVGRQLAFPVDDTTQGISAVKTRQWVIEAVDFNIWFDKRVLRYPPNYTKGINIPGPVWDGAFIRDEMWKYFDLPEGLNDDQYVENIVLMPEGEISGEWGLMAQGTKWRDQMDLIASYSSAVYYIDPDKYFHFHSLETASVDWSFVDKAPNGTSRIACREVSATQDGSMIVTDALVWGGLEVEEAIYFAREQNEDGIEQYGRWQLGEQRFSQGEDQLSVEHRAYALIYGPPGLDPNNTEAGLRFPLWRFRLAWFAHDMPQSGGIPQHIRPGNLVNITLYVMGQDGNPLHRFLPLRNMTVTFPQLAGGGETWVRFEGEFGLSYSDSRFLWAHILDRQRRSNTPVIVGSTTNSSTQSQFGNFATLFPNEPTNGTRKVFTFPFSMLPDTVAVYVNGLLWRRPEEYSITGANEITFRSALAADDTLYVNARTGA